MCNMNPLPTGRMGFRMLVFFLKEDGPVNFKPVCTDFLSVESALNYWAVTYPGVACDAWILNLDSPKGDIVLSLKGECNTL